MSPSANVRQARFIPNANDHNLWLCGLVHIASAPLKDKMDACLERGGVRRSPKCTSFRPQNKWKLKMALNSLWMITQTVVRDENVIFFLNAYASSWCLWGLENNGGLIYRHQLYMEYGLENAQWKPGWRRPSMSRLSTDGQWQKYVRALTSVSISQSESNETVVTGLIMLFLSCN